ncbi:MAG: dihydroorotase family protein, partial [Planctomycetes bacterium]|nr:dihydroorotase family protein [Planctomycetota bacterium]
MDLAINNGLAVLPGNIGHINIGVKNGKIVEIKRSRIRAEEELNASGLLVLPGLVDCHVHFRDPGYLKKEDFFTGTKAACAGGVTTVIDMPNTSPPTNTLKCLDEKTELAEKKASIDFALHFAAKQNEKELPMVQNSIKFYLSSSSDLLLTKDEAEHLSNAADPSAVKCFHAEDDAMIQELTARYQGKQDPEIHGKLRPPEAAVKALEFIETLKGKKHICHVSTEAELSKLTTSTAETTPNYLFLTEKILKEKGN